MERIHDSAGWERYNVWEWYSYDGEDFFPEKIDSICGNEVVVCGKTWVGWEDEKGKTVYTNEKQDMHLSIFLAPPETKEEAELTKKLRKAVREGRHEDAINILVRLDWDHTEWHSATYSLKKGKHRKEERK